TGVDPVARISPTEAVKAVDRYPGFRKRLDGIVPHLNYYFDQAETKWRLMFILEDVPVSASDVKKGETEEKVAPRYMDHVVDPHSGKVVTELPRTPSASTLENAVDGLNKARQFRAQINGNTKVLNDATLNIQTYDFRFRDPDVEEARLPGTAITSPPAW